MSRLAAAPSIVLSFPSLLSSIKLDAGAAGEGPRSWIQIAITGEFEKGGKKFSITRADLAQMVENFKTGAFPTPPTEICVDYEHLTQEEDISPGDTKAAAWFKDLELRADGDELFALVEWTPDGAEDVGKKRYRYFSPVFSKKFKDTAGKELGTTLINGALTNTPFLQGMQPVTLRLSARRRQELHIALTVTSDNEKRRLVENAIRQRFGTWKDDGCGFHYCDTYLIDTNDGAEAIYSKDGVCFIVPFTIGEAGEVTFTAEPAKAQTTYTRLSARGGSSVMSKISLKAANGQTVEVDQAELEALPLVKELRAKLPGDGQKIVSAAEYDALNGTVTTLKASVETLQADNRATKDQLLNREADAAVSALLTAGKLMPTQKDAFVALFKSDKTQFDAITKDLPVVVRLTTRTTGSDTVPVEGDVIAEVEALAVKALAENATLKTKEAAVAHVLRADRTLYDRYNAANVTRV